MRLLIAAATEMEISGIRESLPGRADILITGVGVTASLYRISKILATERYDLAVQAGIAGSFRPDYRPGEIVAVESDIFAGEGIRELGKFTPLASGRLSNGDTGADGWLVNPDIHRAINEIRTVKAVTVSGITDDASHIRELTELFSPEIESMEGASFHYAALMEKQPFLQIRAISNRVGETDKSQWVLAEALANLNRYLLDFFKTLPGN